MQRPSSHGDLSYHDQLLEKKGARLASLLPDDQPHHKCTRCAERALVPTAEPCLRGLLVRVGAMRPKGRFGSLSQAVRAVVLLFPCVSELVGWVCMAAGADSPLLGQLPTGGLAALIGLVLAVLPLVSFVFILVRFGRTCTHNPSHLDRLASTVCWNRCNRFAFTAFQKKVVTRVYVGTPVLALTALGANTAVMHALGELPPWGWDWVAGRAMFLYGALCGVFVNLTAMTMLVLMFRLHLVAFRTIFFFTSKMMVTPRKFIHRHANAKQELFMTSTVVSHYFSAVVLVAVTALGALVIDTALLDHSASLPLVFCSTSQFVVVACTLWSAARVSGEMQDIVVLVNLLLREVTLVHANYHVCGEARIAEAVKLIEQADIEVPVVVAAERVGGDEEQAQASAGQSSSPDQGGFAGHPEPSLSFGSDAALAPQSLSFEEITTISNYLTNSSADMVTGIPVFGITVNKVMLFRVTYVVGVVLLAAAQRQFQRAE